MKYLFPMDNLLTAATGYTPYAESINTRTSADKSGGGLVTLIGGATEDATYDIEIVNNTIVGTPAVSTPVFTGVGNPVMSNLSASGGTAAQVFTVSLIDLGTDTTYAFTPFQGVTLQAKATGSGGNSIVIEVSEGAIVRTGTDFALLEPLTKDANEYVGDQWNFGAVVLNPDGTIPSAAPRISFGADPQVYRQYKEFSDGRYVYRFSPAPVRDVQEGARVYAVTGSRTVTTDNGIGTRTYNSVTTLYSLLNAILSDGSAHVDVVGAVTNDTSPGGMAMIEMSVRTVSYVQSIDRDGTVFVRNAELAVTVTDDAPTELLTLTCKSTDYLGAEVWEVRGSVSGELADAVTDVAYDGTDYDFTIPSVPLPVGEPASTEKSARLELLERGEGEGEPVLCYENFLLGAQARSRVFTYVWRTRPPECDCDDVEVQGEPDGEILGTEEDPVSTLIPSALQTRLQTLYSWKRTFIEAQASILAAATAVTGDSRIAAAGSVLTDITLDDDPLTTGNYTAAFQRVSAVLKIDRVDIDAAERVSALFHACLRDVYDTNSDTIPVAAGTAWDSALTDMQTEFNSISPLIGGEGWRKFSAWVAGATTGDETKAAEAEYGLQLLTEDVADFLKKYRARLEYVAVIGGVEPDFDNATLPGNEVWQDQGGAAWFESLDGLLPIQPGFYYYSSVMGDDDEPVATQEFGIGVGIGCAEFLNSGDKLIITVSLNGNVRVTYQVGDQFRVKVIKGSPVQLGGGQTGTDTQTWRVRGSSAGVLTDYSLYKPTPANYSGGGLTFMITPGGIDSVLGDEFEFYIEGGQFKYRKSGGAWSSNTQIASSVNIDTAGGASIAATFATGSAPSFVIGDTYSFSVKALNTIDRICSPVHGGTFDFDGGIMLVPDDLHMTDATTLDGIVYDTIVFVRATAACNVYVTAKDNAFSYPSINCECVAGDNVFNITDVIRGYDITGLEVIVVNGDSDITPVQMLWLGHPVEIDMPNGIADPGITRKRVKLGTASRPRARLGATIQHSAVAESAFDDFIERLNDSTVSHEGRFAVVWPSGTSTECGIVRFAGEELEVEDERDYQPIDSTDRLLRFSLPLEAVA